MDEEVSTSLVAGRTPWPASLRALEEQKKKEEEEERERKARRQPQEQGCRQESQELEEQQQQQQGGQEERPLEPPPQSPPQPVPPVPQEPGEQEEDLPVFGPPTLAWLLPRAPAAIPAESEIRRTIYGMDGTAPGFLRERRAWEDCFPS